MKETEILRGLAKAKAGQKPIPVTAHQGEAILPVATVQAVGPHNIARMIEETSGTPPMRGLRAGGSYADGSVPAGGASAPRTLRTDAGNLWTRAKNYIAGPSAPTRGTNLTTKPTSSWKAVSNAVENMRTVNPNVGPPKPFLPETTAPAKGFFGKAGAVGSEFMGLRDILSHADNARDSYKEGDYGRAAASGMQAVGNLATPVRRTFGVVDQAARDLTGGGLEDAVAHAYKWGHDFITDADEGGVKLTPEAQKFAQTLKTNSKGNYIAPPAAPSTGTPNGTMSGSIPSAASTLPATQAVAPVPVDVTDLGQEGAAAAAQSIRDGAINIGRMAPGQGMVVSSDGSGGSYIDARNSMRAGAQRNSQAAPQSLEEKLTNEILYGHSHKNADRARAMLADLYGYDANMATASATREKNRNDALLNWEKYQQSLGESGMKLVNDTISGLPGFTTQGKDEEGNPTAAVPNAERIAKFNYWLHTQKPQYAGQTLTSIAGRDPSQAKQMLMSLLPEFQMYEKFDPKDGSVFATDASPQSMQSAKVSEPMILGDWARGKKFTSGTLDKIASSLGFGGASSTITVTLPDGRKQSRSLGEVLEGSVDPAATIRWLQTNGATIPENVWKGKIGG